MSEVEDRSAEQILDQHAKWVRAEDGGRQLVWDGLTVKERTTLYDADLYGATLSGANLDGANLDGANLDGAEGILDAVIQRRRICPDGEFIGYKKLADGTIATLRIPADARRVGGVVGRKCRAEYVEVVDGNGVSYYNGGDTKYEPGVVQPDSFDPDPLVECSHGIHFFITRLEAEEYKFQ